jgi:hypothetical protein
MSNPKHKTQIVTIKLTDTPNGVPLPYLPLCQSNYVEKVSTQSVQVFNATGSPHILMIDCGAKYNQIRCCTVWQLLPRVSILFRFLANVPSITHQGC